MKKRLWGDWGDAIFHIILPIMCFSILGWVICATYPDPFSTRNQNRVFNKVAKYLHIELNPALLPPRVLKGSEVTDEYNNLVFGWDTEGKRSNIFNYETNTIILIDDSKLHNLAHEYTHYFQLNYMGYKVENGCTDAMEIEAIRIQNKFR